MESGLAPTCSKTRSARRQLPITGSAHNARVVRDLGMAARRVLAARDMAAERRRATALDRTHDLQLLEAHLGAVGLSPRRAVIAEDVRDLQSKSNHGRCLRRRRLLTA